MNNNIINKGNKPENNIQIQKQKRKNIMKTTLNFFKNKRNKNDY